MVWRLLVGSVMLPLIVMSGRSHAQSIQYACENRVRFRNAVEIVLKELPPGDYAVAALGVNGFDPKLAVIDAFGREIGCIDDSVDDVRTFSLTLPTTGVIAASPLNARLVFSNRRSAPTDYRMIVGGFADSTGSFALVLENLAVTDESEAGGGLNVQVRVTANMSSSPIPISAYMIGVDSALDPLIQVVDEDNEPLILAGRPASCDDAGTPHCWGESETLANAVINTLRRHVARNFDAMIALPWETLGLVPGAEDTITLRFTSFNRATLGRYLAILHLGIAVPVILDEDKDDETAVELRLTCEMNARRLEGEIGTAIAASCPAGCAPAAVYGTGIYSDDSNICTAAAHAGAIRLESGGAFQIVLADGQSDYTASTQNGITSSRWGAWERSFIIERLGSKAAPETADAELGGRFISGLLIELDQRFVGDWNGIDAVELVGIDASGAEIRQWASGATASSEYDASSTAREIIGPANASDCRTFANAWYALRPRTAESVIVSFATPVMPMAAYIYQVWAPGSIIRVSALDAETGTPVLIPNSADPDRSCPHVFYLPIAP
jgi:hypothetical protein